MFITQKFNITFRGSRCSLSIRMPVTYETEKTIFLSCDLGGYSGLGAIQRSAENHPNAKFYILTETDSVGSASLPFNCTVCEIIQTSGDKRLLAKLPKIQPFVLFPRARKVVWFDANLHLVKDLDALISQANDAEVVLFQHDKRSCISQEAREVIRQGKDSKDSVESWLGYIHEQCFEDDALFQGRCFLLKNNDVVRKFCDLWWQSVLEFSIRDQLSLPYALKVSQCDYKAVSPRILRELVHIKPHNKYETQQYTDTFSGYLKAYLAKVKYSLYRYKNREKS